MMTVPQIDELAAEECREMLARHHVGRLAFLHQGRVDMRPLAFVSRGDWLYLRSAEGEKIDALERIPWAAFEVDDVRGPFDWVSVVAQGTFYELRPGSDEHGAAVRAIRDVMPEAFTVSDPFPDRQIVYGLHVTELSGRRSHRQRAPAEPERPKRVTGPRPRHGDFF